MINMLIVKDYFRRHKWVLSLAVLWVFFCFEDIDLEKALYGHGLFMASAGPIAFFVTRGRIKALVLLPEKQQRLTNTLFFTSVMVLPVIDLVCLAVGWLVVGWYSGGWYTGIFPFPLFHLPLVFLAGIAWSGTLLWLFLEDLISMTKRGKDITQHAFLRPFNLFILIWLPLSYLYGRKISIPIESKLSLLTLGLFLTYLAWCKMPCLYGPPSVQSVQVKAKRLKHKSLKSFSPSLEHFLFGAMISGVLAVVVFLQIRQQHLDMTNMGKKIIAVNSMLLFMAPMLSIGVVWRWTSGIRALRAMPLPSWRIVLTYVQILLAMILGLLSWMGIMVISFHEYLVLKYLFLYGLLIFFTGILLCCLHLLWQLRGTLAGVLFIVTWAFVMMTQGIWSPRSARGELLLQTSSFSSASLLLILTALSCYWLYRLIAYNSSVYRCAGDGNMVL